MPSGCRVGITREALNHQKLSSGGQTPGMTLLPKCFGLMPNTWLASAVITPRESRYSKKVDRLPQKSASSVATPEPATAQVADTPAARARFHANAARLTIASAGTVAAARLYATPGLAPV